MYFPQPHNDNDYPGLPAAVLYREAWWWAVAELREDEYRCERYSGGVEETKIISREAMEEFI